jgi:hypothetical protein
MADSNRYESLAYIKEIGRVQISPAIPKKFFDKGFV